MHRPTRRTRLVSALLAVLALPAVMGPGRCGFALDYTETYLITAPIDRVVLNADDGTVVSTSYEREALLLKRHVFAFEPSLEAADHTVEDRQLLLEAHCKYEGNCSFDHMFETPPAVAFDITMDEARVDLGYTVGDVAVTARSGHFRGVQLGSQQVDIDYDEGQVDLELIAIPAAVVVRVGVGSVVVTVPAGSYACIFAASGELRQTGITCDDAAASVLDLAVEAGDLRVEGVTP